MCNFCVLSRYQGHGRAAKLPWTAVKMLLVLGDKYDVDEFRQEGLRLVEAEYPKDLMNWCLRDLPYNCSKGRFGDPSGLAVIDLVGVARKLRLGDVYLAALYDCCSLDTAVLVEGVSSATGDRHVKLEPRDLIAVLNARTALSKACKEMPQAILSFPGNPKCTNNCWNRLDKVVYRWVLEGSETEYNPLAPVERKFETIARDYDFCDSCLGHYRIQYMRHREGIRDDIDVWMDIEVSTEEFGQSYFFGSIIAPYSRRNMATVDF